MLRQIRIDNKPQRHLFSFLCSERLRRKAETFRLAEIFCGEARCNTRYSLPGQSPVRQIAREKSRMIAQGLLDQDTVERYLAERGSAEDAASLRDALAALS